MEDGNNQSQESSQSESQGSAGHEQTNTAAAPERPDYVPEKFWDAENGAPRTEDLAAAYTKLESERGNWRETVTKELEDERRQGLPDSPDAYGIQNPDDADLVIVPLAEVDSLEPAEGKQYISLDTDSEQWKQFQAFAHEKGLSPEDANGLIRIGAGFLAEKIVTPEQQAEMAKREWEKLGENGEARAEHVYKTLTATLGADHANAIDGMQLTADSIPAIEAMLEKMGQPKFSGGSPETAPAVEEEELRAIMREPDYYDNPAKQQQVEEGYAKLYPGKQATAIR